MNPAGPRPASGGAQLRLLGTPIRFHFTFVIVLLVFLYISFTSAKSPAFYLLLFVGVFVSVLLHELAHALVAKRFGIATNEILMLPIGGVASLDRAPKPREELWISLAGPFVNLFLAFLYFGFTGLQLTSFALIGQKAAMPDDNLLLLLGEANFLLGLFNLLPAFPMDGGRALRAILAMFQSEESATRIATTAGRWLAFAMALFGLINQNPALVFIAIFVYLGASQEALMVRSRVLTAGFTVESAMITDFRVLDHGATLRQAAELLLATSQRDFPVLHGETVLGLLDSASMIRGLAETGPEEYISAYMQREFLSLLPDMDLAEALPTLLQAPFPALVMRDDKLVGLLTSDNISEFLTLRQVGLEPHRSPLLPS